jgi:hypothetical protein
MTPYDRAWSMGSYTRYMTSYDGIWQVVIIPDGALGQADLDSGPSPSHSGWQGVTGIIASSTETHWHWLLDSELKFKLVSP